MALTRRETESMWPDRIGERLFDWPFHPVESWRRVFGDDDMKVEEFVEDDQLVVRAELPGVDPDRDVDVSIVEGNLRIRAERRQEEKVEKRSYRRQEFRYGSFSRVIPLPANAKESDITASYKDGVLEVRAPMVEQAPAKSKIPISRT